MEHRPDVGLDSYDRFFPNQDTLPQGGFGNLIALPLQKKAREAGNSGFVGENLIPYADQWAFLSRLRKITRNEVEAIVCKAEAKGRIVRVHLNISEEEKYFNPCSQETTTRTVDTTTFDVSRIA